MAQETLTLRESREGASFRILFIEGAGPFKRRLMEMGFLPGTKILVKKYAPLRDPVEFVIKGYHVTLRRSEAAMIHVEALEGGQ